MAVDDPVAVEARAQKARASAYLWTGGGLVGVATVLTVRNPPPEFHRGLVIVASAIALAWGAGLLRIGARMPDWAYGPFTILSVAVVTLATFATGSRLSPFAAMMFVWSGTFAHYFLSRRSAVAVSALIATCYGIVVARQPGNDSPVARWIIVNATVVFLSGLVAWLTDRTRVLARTEAAARAAADAARADASALNATLERRVEEQVNELTRLGELRRFVSPQVADTLLDGVHDDLVAPHRRDISVLFCDLRGFTAFTADVEPEEVLDVLSMYYTRVGERLASFAATVGPLAGDGVMAYFNDPIECVDHPKRAVELAIAMRADVAELAGEWKRRGHELGCGIGVASGYATLGVIGFEGKRDYGPLGSVVNRASRLCDEAKDEQILVDAATARRLDGEPALDELGEVWIKGFHRPVPVFEVAPTA